MACAEKTAPVCRKGRGTNRCAGLPSAQSCRSSWASGRTLCGDGFRRRCAEAAESQCTDRYTGFRNSCKYSAFGRGGYYRSCGTWHFCRACGRRFGNAGACRYPVRFGNDAPCGQEKKRLHRLRAVQRGLRRERVRKRSRPGGKAGPDGGSAAVRSGTLHRMPRVRRSVPGRSQSVGAGA